LPLSRRRSRTLPTSSSLCFRRHKDDNDDDDDLIFFDFGISSVFPRSGWVLCSAERWCNLGCNVYEMTQDQIFILVVTANNWVAMGGGLAYYLCLSTSTEFRLD
jgi:hypothetical protein